MSDNNIEHGIKGTLLAMQTKEMADTFLAYLDASAATDSERKKAHDTRVVIEAQNKIIATLVEHTLDLLDQFEEFIDRIDPPE